MDHRSIPVVILCGGKGTRIRDVADDVPKPMIRIGGQPILWHIMKGFAHHGFRRFVLCLGYKSWVIKEYFLNFALAHSDVTVCTGAARAARVHAGAALEDWEVTLAETGLETMTGGRLKRVRPYIDADHFLATYGDGVSDVDVGRLTAEHIKAGRTGTLTAVRPPSRFGELELRGGEVAEFNEKPFVPRGRINGGYFVFRREFLDRMPERPDLVLEREPLIGLARERQLGAHLHDGFWHCMDSSRDYEHLNTLWDKGTAPWAVWVATPRRRACA